MSGKDIAEINEIILEEIEKLKIPENEKELLIKLLHFEKISHNLGKQSYQETYKMMLEETMLKRDK